MPYTLLCWMTLISDRDKGLLTAETAVCGNTIHTPSCCPHLKVKICADLLFWVFKKQHELPIFDLCYGSKSYSIGLQMHIDFAYRQLRANQYCVSPILYHLVPLPSVILHKATKSPLLPIWPTEPALGGYAFNEIFASQANPNPRDYVLYNTCLAANLSAKPVTGFTHGSESKFCMWRDFGTCYCASTWTQNQWVGLKWSAWSQESLVGWFRRLKILWIIQK